MTNALTLGAHHVGLTVPDLDAADQWWRSYGNENWEFEPAGLMARRIASINDLAISAPERLFHWPQGRRPDDHPGLSEMGL